jgi:hypothetical protein
MGQAALLVDADPVAAAPTFTFVILDASRPFPLLLGRDCAQSPGGVWPWACIRALFLLF